MSALSALTASATLAVCGLSPPGAARPLLAAAVLPGAASYPTALVLTLLVEVPVYTVALAAATPATVRRAAAAGAAVNLVTHPALWWFLHALHGAARAPAFAVAEALVCLAEGALAARLLRLPGPVPYAASAAANAASVLAGLLLLG